MKSIYKALIALMLAASLGAPTACAEAAASSATPEAREITEAQVATEAGEAAEATETPAPEPQSDWWNILLMGGDARSEAAYGRTDSIIILSVNARENKAKMTSIMRDTWVHYPGTPITGKINAANVYGGPELAMATVNECFGTEIQDYVLINMSGLVDVIDQVGGVDLPVSSDERKWINTYARDYLKNIGDYGGETSLGETGDSVHLNGLLAMSYCRNRNTGTDYARTQRQRRLLLAFLGKLRAEGPVRQASVIASAFDSVKTDLNFLDLVTLTGVGLKLDSESIEQYRIPADGTFESGMKSGFWSIRPDFDTNREMLREFIYGGGQ
jgi:LCP family protein required for cell wall assembly